MDYANLGGLDNLTKKELLIKYKEIVNQILTININYKNWKILIKLMEKRADEIARQTCLKTAKFRRQILIYRINYKYQQIGLTL